MAQTFVQPVQQGSICETELLTSGNLKLIQVNLVTKRRPCDLKAQADDATNESSLDTPFNFESRQVYGSRFISLFIIIRKRRDEREDRP